MLYHYTFQDSQTSLKESLQEIQLHYPAEPADLPDLTNSKFELLKYYTNFLNRQTIRISNTNTYGSFVEVEYPVPITKYGTGLTKDFQLYVFCFLNEDYGHILIRKETFNDKLNEFFHPVEIDLEYDPMFSKKFYVLAKDKSKALKMLNNQFRQAILKRCNDDIAIEICNNVIVISNKKTVKADDALELITLGYDLSRTEH